MRYVARSIYLAPCVICIFIAGFAWARGDEAPDKRNTSSHKTSESESKKGVAEYFYPKTLPIKWYEGSKLDKPGGVLPNVDQFPVLSTGENFVEIHVRGVIKIRSSVFVRRKQGYLVATDQKIKLTSLIKEKARAPLRFWLEKDALNQFLKVEVNEGVLNDLEEYISTERLGWPDTLPLVDADELNVQIGDFGVRKTKLYKTIIRVPSPRVIRNLQVRGLESEHKLAFLIDSSGSMVPIGRDTIESVIKQLRSEGRYWTTDKRYSAIFFRESGNRVELRVTPFRSLFELKKVVSGRRDRYIGGGDEAEPFLDAIYFAIDRIPWERDLLKENRGRRVVLLFMSGDMHPVARSVPPFVTPKEFNSDTLSTYLKRKSIYLIIAQSSPEPGESIVPFIEKLKSQRDEFIHVIPYQQGMQQKIISTVSQIVGGGAELAAADKQALEFAKSAVDIGGVPVYPTRFRFLRLAKKIETMGHLSDLDEKEWIALEVWTVANSDLMNIIEGR